MYVHSITLHRIRMQLKTPFTASYGSHRDRPVILVEMRNESGLSGWGECTAFETPYYTEETADTAWLIMERFLIPSILGARLDHPSEIPRLFSRVRRHPMAKAALEMAGWDLYCKEKGIPLYQALGGVRDAIESGAAIGMQDSAEALFSRIEQAVSEGFRRVKVKIKPGSDLDLIRSIRSRFPDLPLMADANSAYTLADISHLSRFDEYHLMMIEQPLGADDLVDHAALQQRLSTPVCLDESILSAEDARKALELGSCRIINVKISRVGGLTEAKRIHDLCRERGVPVWCGGMLETGIGRLHAVALASLPGFTIPGDLGGSNRYWERDVVQPEVILEDGLIQVPRGMGIGSEIDREFIASMTEQRKTFRSDGKVES